MDLVFETLPLTHRAWDASDSLELHFIHNLIFAVVKNYRRNSVVADFVLPKVRMDSYLLALPEYSAWAAIGFNLKLAIAPCIFPFGYGGCAWYWRFEQ
jgi:hypothetical protein